jgi:type II secretory pathway component PulJ
MRLKRGASLTEALVALMLSSIVVGGGFWVYLDSTSQSYFAERYSDAEMDARQQVDLLLDHIRNAQSCKDADRAAIKAASATSISYYGSDNVGDVITYGLSGTNLVRSDSSGTKTVLDNVSKLEFTYFVMSSGTLTQTSNLNIPDQSELPLLAAVKVEAMAEFDGVSRELSGTVRLRNSPYKKRL